MIYGQPITFGGSKGPIPDFTYTGDWEAIQEDEINWKIRFLSSGVLTFKKEQVVDAFLVGGGGGGSGGYVSGYYAYSGSGGGGGYTTTGTITLSAGTPYSVTVGAGGSAGAAGYSGAGGTGGKSSLATLKANGGAGGEAGGAGGSGR